jgi:hypothetical protein
LNKELVTVPRATLDFYKYEADGLVYYEFDATECSPPEPMVNAIVGLKMLENKNERLVGIFFHEPFPLYEKIPSTFEHQATELESGDFRVVFNKI